MNCDYQDIRRRIAEPPIWWDERAVPRYDPFHPNSIGNIYANEVALLLISCQSCGQEFKVAHSKDVADDGSLAKDIENKTVYWGDPPNIRCCPSGPTMSSNVLRVVEFWIRVGFGWVLDPAKEVQFEQSEDY